jgi:hypothetical protein
LNYHIVFEVLKLAEWPDVRERWPLSTLSIDGKPCDDVMVLMFVSLEKEGANAIGW